MLTETQNPRAETLVMFVDVVRWKRNENREGGRAREGAIVRCTLGCRVDPISVCSALSVENKSKERRIELIARPPYLHHLGKFQDHTALVITKQ